MGPAARAVAETNGWKVFLTRTSDVNVSNLDRVVFAEPLHADLYISLHFNSTPDRDRNPGGLETYCITPTGMPSTLTRGFSDPGRKTCQTTISTRKISNSPFVSIARFCSHRPERPRRVLFAVRNGFARTKTPGDSD